MTVFPTYKYAVTETPGYKCYTLFDINDKGTRSETRNWNTIVQIISLRTQPFIIEFPKFEITNLKKYRFGKDYKGTAKIWTFEFEVDHPDLFADGNDPIANLISDSKLVPLVDHTNFILPPKCLITSGSSCNIYYEFIC